MFFHLYYFRFVQMQGVALDYVSGKIFGAYNLEDLVNIVFLSLSDGNDYLSRFYFQKTRRCSDGTRYFYFRDLCDNIKPGEFVADWYAKPKSNSSEVPVLTDKVCSRVDCGKVGCTIVCPTCTDTCGASYCSLECKKEDWSTHSNQCRAIMQLDDFRRWFMTGKCGFFHAVLCRLINTLCRKYRFDVITPSGGSDSKIMRVSGAKISEGIRMTTRFDEVISVFDSDRVCPDGSDPRLSDYDPHCVDRLHHVSPHIGICKEHATKCKNRTHIGRHQMASLRLTPMDGGDRYRYSRDSETVILVDMTGAQFGIAPLGDRIGNGGYFSHQLGNGEGDPLRFNAKNHASVYFDATQLSDRGFQFLDLSDFDPTQFNENSWIGDTQESSEGHMNDIVTAYVSRCLSLIRVSTDGCYDRALKRDSAAREFYESLQFKDRLRIDDSTFISHKRVSDDSTLSDVGDFICQIAAEYEFSKMTGIQKDVMSRSVPALYDHQEVSCGLNIRKEFERRVYLMGFKESNPAKFSQIAKEKISPEYRDYWVNILTKSVSQIQHNHGPTCDYCRSKKDKLRKCGRCLSVYYCDTTCQKKGWCNHKLTCKKAESSQDKIEEKK